MVLVLRKTVGCVILRTEAQGCADIVVVQDVQAIIAEGRDVYRRAGAYEYAPYEMCKR